MNKPIELNTEEQELVFDFFTHPMKMIMAILEAQGIMTDQPFIVPIDDMKKVMAKGEGLSLAIDPVSRAVKLIPVTLPPILQETLKDSSDSPAMDSTLH